MTPLDYVDHFKLRCAPFGHPPDADFFYVGQQHEQILDELYHVTRNMLGLAVLTGGVGSGKTTLLRQLQRMLAPETFQVATWVMHQPCTDPMDVYRAIAQRLSIRATATDPDAMLWSVQRFVQSVHYQQRRLVLLIDEAQMLEGAAVMEVLRALLNIEGDGYKHVSIVLAGLETLVDHVACDPAMAARVACHGSLGAFDAQESVAYVQHRLDKAGASHALLGEPVLRRVHALAGGVPRLINTLCDNVLVRLARLGQGEASVELLEEVAERLRLTHPAGNKPLLAARPSAQPPILGVPPKLQPAKTAPTDSAAQDVPETVTSPPPRLDLLAQAHDIAARLAQGSSDLADGITPPAGLALPPPDATVELPGDSWLGVRPAGDFLGNGTPPQGLDARARAHKEDDAVISILGEAQRRFES